MGILPIDKWFIEQSLVADHLRHLTIFGSLMETLQTQQLMYSDISLPALEVLSLREVFFGATFTIPHFPSLNTLQVTLSTTYPGSDAIQVQSTNIPSLRTLELHGDRTSISIERQCHLSALHRLHLVGTYEHDLFLDIQVCLFFDKIRHLVPGLPYKLPTLS